MSTVNKEIADRVAAGEFPEDNIITIIRYNNIFNGAEAYKLIYRHQYPMIQWILDGNEINLINPTLYWSEENSRKNPT